MKDNIEYSYGVCSHWLCARSSNMAMKRDSVRLYAKQPSLERALWLWEDEEPASHRISERPEPRMRMEGRGESRRFAGPPFAEVPSRGARSYVLKNVRSTRRRQRRLPAEKEKRRATNGWGRGGGVLRGKGRTAVLGSSLSFLFNFRFLIVSFSVPRPPSPRCIRRDRREWSHCLPASLLCALPRCERSARIG